MFSIAYCDEVNGYFEGQMALLDDRCAQLRAKEAELPEADKGLCRYSRTLLECKIGEIKGVLARCTQDEGEALRFLYSAMPLSDLLDYPAELYLAYARHGVYLWKEGPFAEKVPEKLFANYVLHHRVHNEDIADTRRFFHDKLIDRIAGKNMYDAAVEVNYWCAEKATYQTTFMRTQNPLTMYGTAAGRCGEEAPFGVTALRSLGIPAREVAAPSWSHCDDNHAWVEAWCDGGWHFLGACEPEECLDSGWFVGPTARAMLIDSAWFGKDAPLEPVAERPDMSAKLNHLALYADTVELVVRVEEEQGKPVPEARVEFAVLNSGKFNRIARLYTGSRKDSEEYGTVRFQTGYGDLLVYAYAGGNYGERLVSLVHADKRTGGETDGRKAGREAEDRVTGNCGTTGYEGAVHREECVIVLRSGLQNLEQWREMDFHAPKAVPYNERKTEEQAAREEAALAAAARSRQQRTADFYRTADADRALKRFGEEDREAVREILLKARGNMGEIVRFLEWDFAGWTAELEQRYGQEHWKLEALETLHENDYWDIRAEVLAECCICASPYASKFPPEVFFPFLLNPCGAFEMPRKCREALLEALGEELKEQIRENPNCLPARLDQMLISLPEQEYANLVTSPMGCLTGGIGNMVSRMVLCINIYRALGIPARMRPLDRTLEYYWKGRFIPIAEEKTAACGKIILQAQEPLKISDWKHYSLARFEDGHFVPLFLRPPRPSRFDRKQAAGQNAVQASAQTKTAGEAEKGKEKLPGSGAFADDRLEQELEQGMYRIVTSNRLPNGNQFVNVYDFCLKEKEEKQITLVMRDTPVEAMLDKVSVNDFALHTMEGDEVRLSSLARKGAALMLWLELTREPTEHILNELYEKRELFAEAAASIYFVIKSSADYRSDTTLARTLEALPRIKLLADGFGEEYEALSCQVGKNPGALPLAVILDGEGNSVYADSGYNVGMVDTLFRILDSYGS